MENNKELWEEVKGTSDVWIPEKINDFIEGEIRELRNGQYGIQAVIKTADKEYLTPSHKVLQSRLAECKIGDIIKIVFVREELPTIKGRKGTLIYQVLKKRLIN